MCRNSLLSCPLEEGSGFHFEVVRGFVCCQPIHVRLFLSLFGQVLITNDFEIEIYLCLCKFVMAALFLSIGARHFDRPRCPYCTAWTKVILGYWRRLLTTPCKASWRDCVPI